MLKAAAPHILDSITNLVNDSILSAEFPDEWKNVLITPLSKVKNPSSLSDTRPIAQISEFSKVLERIVHAQLSDYLEAHGLIDDKQAGFRSGYSTQTALLAVTDDIRYAIDKRMVTIVILFDFSKAFDMIPHAILLKKLRTMGLSPHALRWFYNYLSKRRQAVIDRGGSSMSDWLNTSSGDPQGSVLGPLLFIVFINDLYRVLRYSNHMSFADDLQIYAHCLPRILDESITLIQRDAQAVSDWAHENGLLLNVDKSKVMILGSQSYIFGLDFNAIPPVILNGVPLPFVSECRNLGVTLNPTLD